MSEHTSFDLARLRAELRPFRLYWFPRLRSTNDHAAELRRRGDLFAPAVVLTGHQTAGRGRGVNTWWSRPGSLTVTFAIPIEEHLSPHQLPLIAGLAIRNAVAELAGDADVGLKWPNDIVHGGKKLAGLLCERVHRVDLIGLGLNLNLDPASAPKEIRARTTSLQAITGRELDPTTTLVGLARQLYRTLSSRNERPFQGLLKEYDRYHMLVGRRVVVSGNSGEPPVRGLCEGLDHVGRLLLRNSKGELQRIIAGHVDAL